MAQNLLEDEPILLHPKDYSTVIKDMFPTSSNPKMGTHFNYVSYSGTHRIQPDINTPIGHLENIVKKKVHDLEFNKKFTDWINNP
jgi:hypothetical protein